MVGEATAGKTIRGARSDAADEWWRGGSRGSCRGGKGARGRAIGGSTLGAANRREADMWVLGRARAGAAAAGGSEVGVPSVGGSLGSGKPASRLASLIGVQAKHELFRH